MTMLNGNFSDFWLELLKLKNSDRPNCALRLHLMYTILETLLAIPPGKYWRLGGLLYDKRRAFYMARWMERWCCFMIRMLHE